MTESINFERQVTLIEEISTVFVSIEYIFDRFLNVDFYEMKIKTMRNFPIYIKLEILT